MSYRPTNSPRLLISSPSCFLHIFKAETGTSPARHLHTLRLEHARELLETSLLSVKQVMSSVGIADRSHFDREFKRVYGLTPVQYRATHPLIHPQEQARVGR